MKKVLTVFCLVLLIGTAGLFAGGQSDDAGGMRIGMAVQDLSNPIWSGSAAALRKLVEADGGRFTVVACDSNITKQIQQIENLIASEVDALVVHAADPAGIETVLGEARAAGIKIYAWDDKLENSDIAWLINNYELGYMIGEQAARWINERLNGSAEVAVLNYPQLPILLERGNGIADAINTLAPDAKIVAETSAINPSEGIAKMETIFQSNPNVKIIAAIGGGGAVGANEAAKAAGKITDDFGIFAADATQQELDAIQNNEGNRMSVLITGGYNEIAEEIYGWLKKLVAGESVPSVVYRELIPVDQQNIDRYIGIYQ
jgi:ribose transport system substrate-binding protein